MTTIKRHTLSVIMISIILVFAGIIASIPAISAHTELGGNQINPMNPTQSGTTLTTTVSATGELVREFHWEISKSVSPESLELFVGDVGNPQYTVSVDNTGFTDTTKVSGEVCVNNGGDYWTRDLMIKVSVVNPGMGTPVLAGPVVVDVSSAPFIAPGEEHCYPYMIEFTPEGGDTSYRVDSEVTITNHSGHIDEPFGPETKEDFISPTVPTTFVNQEINVDDTNGLSWGPVSDDMSWMYNQEFTCENGDDYTHDNTATIEETEQNDDATVSVTCHELSVSKTADTSFTRDFDWTIVKSADVTEINVQVNQAPVTVNYEIDVDSSPTDSEHAVSGSITISNPASIAAPLNAVTDKVNDLVDATVDCNMATTVPAMDSLVCTYEASLGGASDGTNKATATIDNYDRTDPNNPVSLGTTTDFMGTAAVTFGDPTTVEDECVTLDDNNPEGPMAQEICADATPANVPYSKNFGPFTEVGMSTHSNTACIATDDGTEKCDTVDIPITVNGPAPPGENPGEGCTLTQGYWKSHTRDGFNGFQHLQIQELIESSPDGKILLGDMVITTVDEAHDVFISAQGDDLVAKLKSQLLTTKLNILSSADGTDIEATITAADTFLSVLGMDEIPKGKAGKDLREEANQLKGELDSYNNGEIGPGHCTS